MVIPSHYRTLGVDPQATDDEIRAAYRRLAKKYHPDANKDDPRAEENFKRISEAYRALSDPSVRSPLGKRQDPPKPSPPAEKPFAKPRAPEEGRSVRMKLYLSLEEAFSGGSKEVRYPRETLCPACAGKGQQSGVACAACEGQGILINDYAVMVDFPMGARPEEEIRIAGSGHQGQSRQFGDLIVIIQYKPHTYLDVKGADLHYRHYLGLEQYIEGGSIPVPTMSGIIQVKLPARFPDGGTLRLKDRGLPEREKLPAGSLLITIEHCLPVKLSQKERSVIHKLMNFPSFSPPVDSQGLIPKGDE